MKFYAVLSHFAKCRNLHVESALPLPKIEGGSANLGNARVKTVKIRLP